MEADECRGKLPPAAPSITNRGQGWGIFDEKEGSSYKDPFKSDSSSTEKSPKFLRHDFDVRDTIYVSVKTEGAGTAKLAAKLTYQDGTTVGEPSQDIAPAGDANHEFQFAKATAWPKGDYKVEVMLDGVSDGTKDITIK